MSISKTMVDAKKIFEYLYVREHVDTPADLIIGFGHFDLNIPRRCALLYKQGWARKILFTGGIGAGTSDLPAAEAIVFRDVLCKEFSEIPEEDIIVESKSTNTGENISMSARVLAERDKGFCFENGIRSVIAVASPYRQRRVWRTLQKQLPTISICNMPPDTTYNHEAAMFALKGESFVELLAGEVNRILHYPEKGFMINDDTPSEVIEAYSGINLSCGVSTTN